MDINQQIEYKYPYEWNRDGMSGLPKVNRLLKALIEEDLTEAQSLIDRGATLRAIDIHTLGHALFYMLENYGIIKFMTDNGFCHNLFSRIECYDREGYVWGLTGVAYARNKYNIMELLFSKGFPPGQFWMNGKTYDLDEYAMETDNTKLINIILSHGYPKKKLLFYGSRNPSMCRYVEDVIILDWKSYGLGDLDAKIKEPVPPKYGFLFREKMEKYEKQKKSYMLECAIKKEHIKRLTSEENEAIRKNKEAERVSRENESIIAQAMLDIINDNPEKFLQDKTYNQDVSKKSIGVAKGYNKNFDSEMRDIERRTFSFVDGNGGYRHWGDSFVDGAGNYVHWGDSFVDGAGNYVRWGESFVDARGKYRNWGDDFVDKAGNWVKCPRQ